MKYFRGIISALLLPCLFSAAPAQAKICYSAAEQEADQLVRLHSQLMVIMLSCRMSSTGASLPALYQQFTKEHLQQIKGAEKLLVQWSGKQSSLDRMRTVYGNLYSKELAELSPPIFCMHYRDYPVTAAAWSRKDLGLVLLKMSGENKGQAPVCQQAMAAAMPKKKK